MMVNRSSTQENENALLKHKMQLLVTQVRKSWQANLMRLTHNDEEFVSRIMGGSDGPREPAAAAVPSPPPLMTLEDRIRSLPPRSEIGGQIRNWFEDILAQKSQMLMAANRERIKSFNQFRLRLLPLHDEVLQKITLIFQKYQPIEGDSGGGGVTGNSNGISAEIQAFLAKHHMELSDIASKWIIPQSTAAALLKFVLLVQDELLHWVPVSPPVAALPLRTPVSATTATTTTTHNPSQYMQLLQAQQQRRDELYRERQLQINQMKDAAAKQNRDRRETFQKWATEAPFPGWIRKLDQLVEKESHQSMLEWQNTTLRQRRIAADLHYLLGIYAEKHLQSMIREICHALQEVLQRYEQTFLSKTQPTMQYIQTVLRNLPERELLELREWMSLREQIFEWRVVFSKTMVDLSSVSVSILVPRQKEWRTVPS